MDVKTFLIETEEFKMEYMSIDDYIYICNNFTKLCKIHSIELSVKDNVLRYGVLKDEVLRQLSLHRLKQETKEAVLDTIKKEGYELIEKEDIEYKYPDRIKRYIEDIHSYTIETHSLNGASYELDLILRDNQIAVYRGKSKLGAIDLFKRGEFNQWRLTLFLEELGKTEDLPLTVSSYFLREIEKEGFNEMKILK